MIPYEYANKVPFSDLKISFLHFPRITIITFESNVLARPVFVQDRNNLSDPDYFISLIVSQPTAINYSGNKVGALMTSKKPRCAARTYGWYISNILQGRPGKTSEE